MFKKIDTKAIRDLTTAMKDLTAVIRDLNDLPSYKDREAIRIASERLEIDKLKNAVEENDDNTGVVLLPPVLSEDDEEEEDCKNCEEEGIDNDHMAATAQTD